MTSVNAVSRVTRNGPRRIVLAEAAGDRELVGEQDHARVRRVPVERLALPGEDAHRVGEEQPLGAQVAAHRDRPAPRSALRGREDEALVEAIDRHAGSGLPRGRRGRGRSQAAERGVAGAARRWRGRPRGRTTRGRPSSRPRGPSRGSPRAEAEAPRVGNSPRSSGRPRPRDSTGRARVGRRGRGSRTSAPGAGRARGRRRGKPARAREADAQGLGGAGAEDARPSRRRKARISRRETERRGSSVPTPRVAHSGSFIRSQPAIAGSRP